MVRKKLRVPAFAAIALIFILSGCNSSAPVHPLDGPSLNLTVPPPFGGGIQPSFTLVLFLKYRISSGADAVTGILDYNDLQNIAGPIRIPLPHGGKWLVSAEWLMNGVTPVYIGADLVDVKGATDFDLKMGNLNAACYQISLSDTASTAGYPDLFGFDNYFSGSSTVTSGGDIQCLYDAPTPSVYIRATSGLIPRFTYLGNGDWVHYTAIPPSATFHYNTLSAKMAVEGAAVAGTVMEVGDVYAMRISNSVTAWFQVGQVDNLTPAPFVQLYFRLNRSGYPYLKFDVTAYGDVNCNTSGVTLY